MKPRRLVETPDEAPGEGGTRRRACPWNYQPLEERGRPEQEREVKEEKKAKKKEKYKKYKKNVRRALRFSWKCLLLGLQNLAVGYNTPLSALVPEYTRAQEHH